MTWAAVVTGHCAPLERSSEEPGSLSTLISNHLTQGEISRWTDSSMHSSPELLVHALTSLLNWMLSQVKVPQEKTELALSRNCIKFFFLDATLSPNSTSNFRSREYPSDKPGFWKRLSPTSLALTFPAALHVSQSFLQISVRLIFWRPAQCRRLQEAFLGPFCPPACSWNT